MLWDLSGFCITAVRRWRVLKWKTLCETAITDFKRGEKTREKAARLEFQQDSRAHQMRVGEERDAVVGCALTSAGLYPQSPLGHTAPSRERRDFFFFPSMCYLRPFSCGYLFYLVVDVSVAAPESFRRWSDTPWVFSSVLRRVLAARFYYKGKKFRRWQAHSYSVCLHHSDPMNLRYIQSS